MWAQKQHIPNRLTAYRIYAIPLLVLAAWFETWWVFLVIEVFGFITDILDGFLARKWKVVSAFGRDFDTNADKVFIVGILAIFTIQHDFPVTFFVLIMARELIIFFTRSKGLAPAVRLYGKAKMWFQCALCLLLPLQELGLVDQGHVYILGIITTLITLVTGAMYLVPNKKAPR